MGTVHSNRTESFVIAIDSLDVAPIIDAIETGPRAILSRTGNFAAHGVNLVRAHVRASGNPITVVVDLPELPEPGTEISISPDGVVTGVFQGESRVPLDRHGDRAHVAMDVALSMILGRSYWPDRSYDPFTASLMIPGLARDASRLVDRSVDAWREESGHIWFGAEAPSAERLTSLALDPELATARIDEQARLYAGIVGTIADLRAGRASAPEIYRVLAGLVQDYFSVFLLFHNDYDIVIAELTGPDELDDVLQSTLTAWVLDERLRLHIMKSLWEPGLPLAIPPFGIADDLARADAAVASELASLAARVFVLKEWKFFVNKLLFREFSCTCRRLFDDATIRRLAQRPFDDGIVP